MSETHLGEFRHFSGQLSHIYHCHFLSSTTGIIFSPFNESLKDHYFFQKHCIRCGRKGLEGHVKLLGDTFQQLLLFPGHHKHTREKQFVGHGIRLSCFKVTAHFFFNFSFCLSACLLCSQTVLMLFGFFIVKHIDNLK